MYLGKGNQMVFDISSHEKFISFIEFRSFEDIGLDPYGLKTSTCSIFAYLTIHKKYQRMHVNILLIDPYYEDMQISLIKSYRYFISDE